MSDRTFSPVDMQEMMDEGVLMAANEAFFWPLGLALSWTVEGGAHGKYEGGLHLREWVFEDEHKERIVLAPTDIVGIGRRRRFRRWLKARRAALGQKPPKDKEVSGR